MEHIPVALGVSGRRESGGVCFVGVAGLAGVEALAWFCFFGDCVGV